MTHKAEVPVALSATVTGLFKTGVITDSPIPALLGLEGIDSNNMLLDPKRNRCYLLGPRGYNIQLSPGSTVHMLQRAETGHLMLPISNWNHVKAPAERVKHVVFASDIQSTVEYTPDSAANIQYKSTLFVCDSNAIATARSFPAAQTVILDKLAPCNELTTAINQAKPNQVWFASTAAGNTIKNRTLRRDARRLAEQQKSERSMLFSTCLAPFCAA